MGISNSCERWEHMDMMFKDKPEMIFCFAVNSPLNTFYIHSPTLVSHFLSKMKIYIVDNIQQLLAIINLRNVWS